MGAATSTSILGPYIPLNYSLGKFCPAPTPPKSALTQVQYAPLAQGGAIDASGFKDWSSKGYGWGRNPSLWNGWGPTPGSSNSWVEPAWTQGGNGGQRYITYKIDGNSIGHVGICGNDVAPFVPTPINLQAVAADGVTLQGGPMTLLDNEGLTDDGVVEAPSLVKSAEGEYVLFFSRGCYSTNYTVSYATANNVAGPYTRRADLLADGVDGLSGPGGADVLWDTVHMVFHANAASNYTNDRLLHTAIIDIEGVNVIA